MLLRFAVANHKSIYDLMELNLTATKAIKDDGPDLIDGPEQRFKVNPVALIYGANASGKSAIYDAIRMMRMHVVKSFGLNPDAPIPRNPFALNADGPKEDTHFDCDFVIEGVRFHYGFEFNENEFTREWLYSFPSGYRRLLFNRDIVAGPMEFGKTLRGKNKTIEEITRPNCLFLSAAAQGAHEQLSKVFNFFQNNVVSINPALNNSQVQKKVAAANDERITEFLKHADTGITALKVETVKPPEQVLKVIDAVRGAIRETDAEVEFGPSMDAVELSFGHTSGAGSPTFLPFSEESRGTRRLAAMMVDVFSALDGGKVLLIDELDVSIHSHLSTEIIKLFSEKGSNPKGAQLVATTHDTHLLCSELVRRDQVWFVEKSAGMSHLYPLTDIKTRNTDNLQKGYLQGRFGAVPFLGSQRALFVEANNG